MRFPYFRQGSGPEDPGEGAERALPTACSLARRAGVVHEVPVAVLVVPRGPHARPTAGVVTFERTDT